VKALICLGLWSAFVACSCAAQDAPLPVTPAEHLVSYDTAAGRPNGNEITNASTGAVVAAQPAASRAVRTADSRFFLLSGGFLATAVFDVELTQSCIANHRCREQNPLMPSSHAGQLGINIGLAAGVSAASYWLKKHRSNLWWLPSATGLAVHTAGVATGLEHR